MAVTLKEFVIDTFAEQRIDFNDKKVDEMIKSITNYAKKKKGTENCVALSDDEVKAFILEDTAKLDQYKAEEEERKKQIAEEQRQKKLEKELAKERKASGGEQMSLFG